MECRLRNCSNKEKARGYCKTHYHQYIFMPKHPLYYIWSTMIQRCTNPKHSRYADWGGRGIKVCDEWLQDYFTFEKDVGLRPTPFHQIDRINNEGNYEPGNIRWSTPILQARNRRKKKTNTSGMTGVCYSIRQKQWQASITVNKRRIHLGWFNDIEDAMTARARAEGTYF